MTYQSDIADPGLDDLLDLTALQLIERIGGPMPARVTAYDMATQRASVQPLVLVPCNGALKQLDVFQEVPVIWPSGATWSLVGDMAKDDLVWLVPAGADIGHWQASGAANSPAATLRKFDMSDVVAWPGGRPLSSPLPSTSYAPGAVVLGAPMLLLGNSGATDFVALASKVLAELGKIETAFNSHTHGALGLLDSLGAPCTGATAAGPTYTKASVAATKVKAI